jgi:hypothetical protein
MGDRAHLRRQGDMRELGERDEIFPGRAAYSAVPNSVLRKGAWLRRSFTLSTINFLKKISPLKLAGPAKPFLNSRAELRVVALFIACR